jgi:uncharacterized SAM-binding protein YcdF (DUF218 family)
MNLRPVMNAAILWLMPLGLALLGAASALWRGRHHPRRGRRLLIGTLAALWLVSTPWCARVVLGWLSGAPVDPLLTAPAQTVVVLGGGKYYAAPEFGGHTAGELTLVRLRYAAALHRQTGKPIRVSGGNPEGSPLSEAQVMKATLKNEWRVPVQWGENASRNTLENARLSREVLAPLKINRIYLVTHAWHMPRAHYAFERAQFNVVPRRRDSLPALRPICWITSRMPMHCATAHTSFTKCWACFGIG